MKFMMNTDNLIILKGRVARLNTYAGGKAMNIALAVYDPNTESDSFVNLKSFAQESFRNLIIGMPVIVYGHVGNASYKDKDGNIRYKDNNDLIADVIEYNETIKETQKRVIKNFEKEIEKKIGEDKDA